MATISFKTRKGKTNSASIYLIFSYGRKNELRYSTGLKVADLNNWNEAKQRIKNVIAEPNSTNINKKLGEIEIHFETRYQELLASNIKITNTVLRNELDIYLGKKKLVQSPSSFKPLLECYEFYYTHFAHNPLPTTKRPLALGTLKSYRTSNKILQEFNDEVYALSYERITKDFYYDFLGFLEKKGFSNNYISNHIKMLKTVMNYSWELKFHNNLDFKSRSFSKISEEVNNIYLNTDELRAINELELTGRMDNARDLFIIGAYTGLRVSDFNRLTKENIKSDNGEPYFEIRTKKTNRIVVIPINTILQRILNKRDGNPPKKMPEQNINVLLKKIGVLAELDDFVQIEKTMGGKKTIIEKPKHELITNHTARRSFCTNAYKAGIPTFDIMQISGHKTEKSFYKYIKITPLEALRKASKHSFFN